MISDDIKVVLRFTFRNEGLGVAIYTEDFDISARLRFNGETFYSYLVFKVAGAALFKKYPGLASGHFLVVKYIADWTVAKR